MNRTLKSQRDNLAMKLSLVTQQLRLLVFSTKECVSAINDELGQCGKDEIEDHPMLAKHNRISDEAEQQIKSAERAIAKSEKK